MVIKHVVFQSPVGADIIIPIGIEIEKDKLLDICQDIISHLWFTDEDEISNVSIVEEDL